MFDVKNFDEFIKQKNKLLIYFCACSCSFPLIFLFVFFLINILKIEESLQVRYVLYSVFIYIICSWIFVVPLMLKMMAYSSFCNIVLKTKKYRELAKKRDILLKDIIKNNNLEETDIFELPDENSILKPEDFKWEENIQLWINNHVNQLNSKDKKRLKSIQAECYECLAFYVSSALSYCKYYEKNIKTKRYSEPLIPPMFFDRSDVVFFNEAEKIYVYHKGR